MGILNALLGGTQGLGQGLAIRQKFRAEQDDKLYAQEDRAAQTNVRVKQAEAADRLARQNEDLSSQDFQDTYLKALDGDKVAKSNVMRRAFGHPNATSMLTPLTQPTPRAPLTTGTGPDGQPVRMVDAVGVKPYVPPEKVNEPDLAPTPGPNGTVVLAPKKAGLVVPGATPTPRMARAPTEAQEKSYLFYNLMSKAEPELEAAMASGAVRPAAISAYLAAVNVPFAGGALQPIANSMLNTEEQQLLRAGLDFTAGVKRKESGAAVSKNEITETFSRYFPGVFGDDPGLTESKKAARKAYMDTMKQSASPAIMYYSQVEKQGNPEIDAGAEAGDPGGGNVAPARSPSPAITPGDESTMSDADLWEQKRRGGMSAMQATAFVANRKRKRTP